MVPKPKLAAREGWKLAALLAVSLGVLYYFADMGLNRFALGDGWTILWPLNGVTVGLLIMRPRSDWFAIFAGTFLGIGMGECSDGNPLWIVVTERLYSATEVGLCALVLPRFESLESWLRTPRLSLRLYLALLAGPGISGLIGLDKLEVQGTAVPVCVRWMGGCGCPWDRRNSSIGTFGSFSRDAFTLPGEKSAQDARHARSLL